MTTHPMNPTHTYPTGAVLFICPECGRELIQFGLTRIALVEGDNTACHSGGTDGLVIGAVEVETVDPRLEPFSDWLEARNDGK